MSESRHAAGDMCSSFTALCIYLSAGLMFYSTFCAAQDGQLEGMLIKHINLSLYCAYIPDHITCVIEDSIIFAEISLDSD